MFSVRSAMRLECREIRACPELVQNHEFTSSVLLEATAGKGGGRPSTTQPSRRWRRAARPLARPGVRDADGRSHSLEDGVGTPIAIRADQQ